jgi:hypothetical protein
MAIAGANETFKKLSSQIESQFPGFIREEGPQFVAFLKAYFEYMEQNGKVVNATRSLSDYRDIDRTLDSFVEYFRREFMANIPKDSLADQRLLVKNIREFYRSRGTPESYRFLFRALFNKEVDFYYPGDDILRASDGRWLRESKLRVSDPKNINPTMLGGVKVTGATSGATAVIQGVISTIASGTVVYDMTVENISGTFVDGERVFDENNNYVTINSQIGPATSINITNGGSRHVLGDTIEITGAGSTSKAVATVSKVKQTSGISARIVKGGSGYTKNNTRVVIDGQGSGAEIVVASFTPQSIATALNADLIVNMKDVRLDSDFFVRKGANTAAVTKKLTGTLKAKTSTNTVYGIGTAFNTELAVGDIVRITGSSTALRVHSIGGAQTFITTTRTNVNARANGYSKLAAANVSSTLQSALSFSTSSFYTIDTISVINPGTDYNELPTITLIDDEVSKLNVDDGYGGYLGRNAVIMAEKLTGEIEELKIVNSGSNFNKYSLANLYNSTQGNNSVITSYSSSAVNGSPTTSRTILKKTYSGKGFAVPTGVTTYPGKYVDTKGFLSWNNKLQDNYYYQEFSYVIRVTELLDKYRDVVKKLLHPAGTKLFADYQINAYINNPIVAATRLANELHHVESITATDQYVGRNVTNAAITESITPTDVFNGKNIINVNTGTQSITASDNFVGLTTALGILSEFITASDSGFVGTNQATASILEPTGIIQPYASTLISTYQSTQINQIVDLTLNLDDVVNRS